MRKESEYCKGYLIGTSYTSESADDLMSGDYDVAFLSSSWDSRCLSITQATGFRAKQIITLLPSQRDRKGLRDKHDAMIEKFARQHGNFSPIELTCQADSAEWQKIERKVLEERQHVGRPLHIAIDVSACSRYYTVGLLAFCLKQPISSIVTLFYAEGVYPQRASNSSIDIEFTGEKWTTVAIPYCEGQFFPGKNRFYLVSVGFEGWKTFRVLSKADPDRVSLLFPNPGILEEYVERTQKDNETIIAHYKIPDMEIINAKAGDAIEAWMNLSERKVERPEDENCFYLCSGTKPHAIALGLRSIAVGDATVLYVLADQHKVVDINPAGIFWRYDIKDLTANIEG